MKAEGSQHLQSPLSNHKYSPHLNCEHHCRLFTYIRRDSLAECVHPYLKVPTYSLYLNRLHVSSCGADASVSNESCAGHVQVMCRSCDNHHVPYFDNPNSKSINSMLRTSRASVTKPNLTSAKCQYHLVLKLSFTPQS